MPDRLSVTVHGWAEPEAAMDGDLRAEQNVPDCPVLQGFGGPGDGGQRSVWIFADVPLGTVSGVSYMVESWQRELGETGWRTRTFTPSGGWRARSSDESAVTFRTWRHIAFRGDYHARFSCLAQLWKARRELPDVVLVTTPSRVGLLGVLLAAVHSVALVMVVATDTTGAARYYSPGRAALGLGLKPVTVALVGARARRALFTRTARPARGVARGVARDGDREPGTTWVVRLAAHLGNAVQAQAAELIFLSPKGVPAVGTDGGPLVTTVPAGVDRLPACPPPPELCWREGALRVLYVGRFAPEKSLPLLLRGLRLAVDAGVDAQLAMVGGGHLREELAAQAARLGIADRVSLVGPFERSALGGVYASADVFAFPSVSDTQAFVLNEAAHEGLPLLVSDSRINQVVRDGQSAIVVAHDPAAYAGALVRLQDPQLRATLGEAARRRARGVGEAAQSARLAAVLVRAAGAAELSVARPARPARRLGSRARAG